MRILIWMSVFQVCFGHHTLIFNTNKDIRLMRGQKKTQIIVKDLQEAISVDYLYKDSLVCWTDASIKHRAEEIACSNYSSANPHKMTIARNGITVPQGIACDWLTKKLYWTDRGDLEIYIPPKIEVVSLETKHRKVLYWQDLDQPRGIVVDPLVGMMFWTDWGDPPKIQRASMNGEPNSRHAIVIDGLFWPNGISLDVHTKELFWVDGRYSRLEMSDYNGANRKVVWEKIFIPYPMAVSVTGDKIYWTDWKDLSLYSLDRKNGSKPSTVIHLANPPIVDVQVLDANHQPYQWTACEQNNGGCSHLCLLSSGPDKYSCACPTGIKLVNNKTCAEREELFLLLVQWEEIVKISLDTSDLSRIEIPLKEVKHAVGIDFDPVEQSFYWTDQQLKSIRKARLDGSKQENMIVNDVLDPDGIAVDWAARNIYWSDTGANRIEMYRMKTEYRKTIIFEDLEEPRPVVVAPQYGWLFWSDWNEEKPKIERSDLDGANRLVIVKQDISWPNGLALDVENKRLYWGDAKTDKIEMVTMDGKDRREILNRNLQHIYGLTLLGEHLYWTDSDLRTLERVNKHSGEDRMLLLEMSNLRGIKAVNASAKLETNACSANNGDCDQFCIHKPSKQPLCMCQVEYELAADNKTCRLPEAFLILYSNAGIHKVSTNNGVRHEMVPITGIESISAMDVNVADKRIYWAETNDKISSINRAFINGSRHEKVVEFGVQSPESLAVDWLSMNVYWTDTATRRIEVAKLNGQFRRVLFWTNLKEPRNVVLDPRVGYMFWSEWSSGSGTIVKATMDGSPMSDGVARWPIVTKLGIVNSLTIDMAQRFLYWTSYDNNIGRIERCDSEGRNRLALVIRENFRPFNIVQNQELLFWTNWNNMSVMQTNKQNGLDSKVLYDHYEQINDLQMVDTTKQKGWNACVNSSCKYLCLVRPSLAMDLTTDPVCACPSHYTMRSNGCQPPESYLLFSQRNSVQRLTTSLNECPDIPLPMHGFRSIRAIEYDVSTRFIYWIDAKASMIKRTNRTFSSVVINNNADDEEDELLASGGGGSTFGNRQYFHFYDIVLDPYSKLLFWSCSVTDTINMTRINHTNFAESVFRPTHGEKPRSLAVHPEKALLFFVDMGRRPGIVQMQFNGEKRAFVDTENQTVDALIVDYQTNTLFFSYIDKLFVYNLLKADKPKVLISGKRITNMAVIHSYLYWVDKDVQRIQRVDKATGDNLISVTERLQQVTDLISVVPLDDNLYRSHPCSALNHFGNCSHICVPSAENPYRPECACPLGLRLNSDQKTCSVQPPCGPEHFTCRSPNGECVPRKWQCDGQVDCLDGSDEEGCHECSKYEHKCELGVCIKSVYVCDGVPHCHNGTDELNCCSPEHLRLGSVYFPCASNDGCILRSFVCDGYENCEDGSDESQLLCNNINYHKIDNDGEDSPIFIKIVLGMVVTVIALMAFVTCAGVRLYRKRFDGAPVDAQDAVAMTPLAPNGVCSQVKPLARCNGTAQPVVNGGGSSGSCERSYITGASSWVSVNIPLNPPPSPTTTILQEEYCCDQYSLPPHPTTYRSNSSETPSPSSSMYFSKPLPQPPPPPPSPTY